MVRAFVVRGATRAAAEAFAATDPFVVHGVVQSYRVLEWRDVLG